MAGVSCTKVKLLTDGGSENTVIGSDGDLRGLAQHVVAQVDIVQSNSLIERLWHQLRHRWLYLHQLDSFAALEKLIAAYMTDHNTRIPLLVLGGRTPDEAYFGREEDLPARLAEQHREAQRSRVVVNRALSCAVCSSPGVDGAGGHASVQEHPRPVR